MALAKAKGQTLSATKEEIVDVNESGTQSLYRMLEEEVVPLYYEYDSE
jgi:hypothetical protein